MDNDNLSLTFASNAKAERNAYTFLLSSSSSLKRYHANELQNT